MEFLQNLLDNSPYAFLTAFILGLMTAISPCPLATTITAIGYISRDLEDKRKVIRSGMLYTLGRAFSYTFLAVILYLGASKLHVSLFFQGWGEKVLGPLMILIGLFMLGLFRMVFPGYGNWTEKLGEKSKRSAWSTFLLGAVFALAFCPYSGVLYFALLIPMTISSASGLYLPVIFAVATGLPVLIFSWLLAYAVGGVGAFYHKIQLFEHWFRKVVAVVFILLGVYYTWTVFFKV